MGAKSSIEWTDATWNPTRGCSMAKGSETGGCLNCYAARMHVRSLPGLVSPTTGSPFAVMRPSGPRWTGAVELIEKSLTLPLHWRRPRRIFVNSQSDLFHEGFSDEQIDRVFAVMALCPHHTFQVLTKRPERMHRYISDTAMRGIGLGHDVTLRIAELNNLAPIEIRRAWPLPNVWLGVSVENQPTADARIPLLLRTPAAKRFISYEPALGPVDFRNVAFDMSGITHDLIEWRTRRGEVVTRESYENYPKFLGIDSLTGANPASEMPGIDWIIAGGESGPGARPADPAWFRSFRDQCAEAGVPFFFKQWGDWLPPDCDGARIEGQPQEINSSDAPIRVGKKKAGALLDGCEHREFPSERAA